MKIVGRERLDAFSKKHTDSREWIGSWLHETEGVQWKSPQDIKNRFSNASFIVGNRVIFNVKGNDYRMEVVVAYKTGVVSIAWIGTHAEYDERNRTRRGKD